MKILAIDTSAIVGSVALTEDETLIGQYTINNGNTHSETLLPMVESLLSLSGIGADEIGLFAVSNGPGSFTGVRIGVASIKGLAFGSGKPCVGVSTLEALAYNLIGFEGILCPVMNARRSQVYNALFECRGGKLTRLTPDRALSIAELDEELSKLDSPFYLTGDGYDVTVEGLSKSTPAFTPEISRYQSAYSVAQCAKAAFERGEYTNDTDLTVTYLRPSQAERERLEKESNNQI